MPIYFGSNMHKTNQQKSLVVKSNLEKNSFAIIFNFSRFGIEARIKDMAGIEQKETDRACLGQKPQMGH